jgi:hypothetical protein
MFTTYKLMAAGGAKPPILAATNTYNFSSSLTIAAGVTAINFSLQGAGAGAAGANANDVSWFQSPGGGAGGNARGWVGVIAGDVIAITIGPGGLGALGKSWGQNGGISTLSKNGVVFATCNGGSTFTPGGTATITGVVINGATQTGADGVYSPVSFTGGDGASSPNGTGGIGRFRATGGNATGFGAGGGGTGTNLAENRAGGNGSGGRCTIRSWTRAKYSEELGFTL